VGGRTRDLPDYSINPICEMRIIIRGNRSIYVCIESRTCCSTKEWRVLMKKLILAAFAAVSLSAAVAPLANAAVSHNGSTVAGDATATRWQQTGAI
jgi:hypothetical protein